MTRAELQAKIEAYNKTVVEHQQQAAFHTEQAQRAIGAIFALDELLKSLPEDALSEIEAKD
jgi:hypothetical protein